MNDIGLFHPLIQKWFNRRMGEPTDIQKRAWGPISGGQHVLVSAPTGSGKTLTAFLWALNQLITGHYDVGETSVLYISPLKALNNDIQRNLLTPLEELRRIFEENGEFFPDLSVLTRSGDTPAADRRRMQMHPPEILITTPESLNLLLSSPGNRAILTKIKTVILDEIHAVVTNKRGTYLISAVDRLVPLAGEFQRIGISATVNPMELVAQFLGGMKMEGAGPDMKYIPRDVMRISSGAGKKYGITVEYPEIPEDLPDDADSWVSLVQDFKREIKKNNSTLLFANSRQLVEKITHLINLGEPKPVAYAHHGSLSKAIRLEVERKLKSGVLKAIVATSSLELGIDIGALDAVINIQSPNRVSSAIQRIGRAGHGVGEVSRGILVPTHSFDFLTSAVLARNVLDQDIELIKPIEGALDVLSLIIISMVGTECWDIDDLYYFLKSTYPYRNLSRKHFDLVLEMLAGRYSETRIRSLKPRISMDRLENTVKGRKGALQAFYFSGGVIPDRGYYQLRYEDSAGKIGELDEEFVWEARVGQIFTLGTQNWRIKKITHNDVFVVPAPSHGTSPPFWKAEENDRDFHFSSRISSFLEYAEQNLQDSKFVDYLLEHYQMNRISAEALVGFLQKQKRHTGRPLSHHGHLLFEWVESSSGAVPGNQLIIHTHWGGRVNRPFILALDAAWEERYRERLDFHVSDESIVLQLPQRVPVEAIISLVTSKSVEGLLRKRLEGSGFFGARFRECAGRALLVTRNKMNQRLPLWVSRMRSQKLLNVVMQYSDFPILLETWRSCLQDEFDMEHLHGLLDDLACGAISWSETSNTQPSPFARQVAWRQINAYMYQDDTLASGAKSRLSDDLLKAIISDQEFRPAISSDLVTQFEIKRQRIFPGYSPDTPDDLLDWLKERIFIPKSEWQHLTGIVAESLGQPEDRFLEPVKEKCCWLVPAGAKEPLLASLERVPDLIKSLFPADSRLVVVYYDGGNYYPETFSHYEQSADADADMDERATRGLNFVFEFLSFYGPRKKEWLEATFGSDCITGNWIFEELKESGQWIEGPLIEGDAGHHYCDTENYESLLRMARAARSAGFKPVSAGKLPQLLASVQGLASRGDGMEQLFEVISTLEFFPATPALWESDILPARLEPYLLTWMDSLMQQGDLRWYGDKIKRIRFAFQSDLDLFDPEGEAQKNIDDNGDGDLHSPEQESSGDANAIIRKIIHTLKGEPEGLSFNTIRARLQNPGSRISKAIWQAVWNSQVNNDTYSALRRGLETRFRNLDNESNGSGTGQGVSPRIGSRRGFRQKFDQWKKAQPAVGKWYYVNRNNRDEDLISAEERKKDRIRILLERYGVIFRELLVHESGAFSWRALFRTLRLMELSGEIIGGSFFREIASVQFTTAKILRQLKSENSSREIYWINACDPASLCGSGIDYFRSYLPRRIPSNHLVYEGSEIRVISKKWGKELQILDSETSEKLPLYFSFLGNILKRQFQPEARILIETINNEKANSSPYTDVFKLLFDVNEEPKGISLFRKRR